MDKTSEPKQCLMEIDAAMNSLKTIDAKELKAKPYYSSQAMVHLMELKAELLFQKAETSETPENEIGESLTVLGTLIENLVK